MVSSNTTGLEMKPPTRRMRRGRLLALLVATGLAGLASCSSISEPVSETTDPAEQIADGRRLANLRCASCHAIDRDDFSANPDAPPMKRLSSRLVFKTLERSPPRDVDMTHGAMPPLRLSRFEMEALVAYFESIED